MARTTLALCLLCLAAPCLARRELAAAATTQAGCACQPKWRYDYNETGFVVVSGCANPDKDPKGAWCPVDPVDCINHYGNYTWLDKTVHYDYCGPVRVVTEKGCLCKSVSLNRKDGKPYLDSCMVGNKGASFCRVDARACKAGTPDYPDPYGICEGVQDESGVPDGQPTTQGGCECAPTWKYKFDHSQSGKFGPYQGCSNEDRDPKGAWCVVNKATCPSWYGKFKDADWNTDVYYAYCGDVNEITQAGCMCKASWGGGKMRDKCGNPDNKPGLWCEIMPGTCKKKPFGKTWDFCGSIPDSLKPKATNTSRAAPGPAPAPITLVLNSSNADASSSHKSAGGGGGGGGVNKLFIIVPILTGCAALVTICYTLYKCHKKRQFFQGVSILKFSKLMQQASGGSVGADPASGLPAAAVKDMDRSETLTYGPYGHAVAAKSTV